MINVLDITIPIVSSAAMLVATGVNIDRAKDYLSLPLIEGWSVRMTPVTAGDVELLEWNITKRTSCPGVSSRVWNGEDGFYMVEPLRKTALPMNEEEQTYRIPTEIPRLAPEGDLQLSIKGHYDCDGEMFEYSLGPVELIVEAK